MNWLRRSAECIAQGRPAALVTVTHAQGSTPRKPGSRMLVFADGSIEGTIGGGKVEQAVIADGLHALKTGQSKSIEYALTNALGMCCGGQMTFFVEPLQAEPPLIVFGLGHVGRAIAVAARALGFRLTLVDGANECDVNTLPQHETFLDSFAVADLRSLPFGDTTYVVIATREHSIDQQLLEFCCNNQWRYLGVIGSQRKAAMQHRRLEAKGFSAAQIAAVRCPMGLMINAETPEEIAISVCAELISVRRTAAAMPNATKDVK